MGRTNLGISLLQQLMEMLWKLLRELRLGIIMLVLLVLMKLVGYFWNARN